MVVASEIGLKLIFLNTVGLILSKINNHLQTPLATGQDQRCHAATIFPLYSLNSQLNWEMRFLQPLSLWVPLFTLLPYMLCTPTWSPSQYNKREGNKWKDHGREVCDPFISQVSCQLKHTVRISNCDVSTRRKTTHPDTQLECYKIKSFIWLLFYLSWIFPPDSLWISDL